MRAAVILAQRKLRAWGEVNHLLDTVAHLARVLQAEPLPWAAIVPSSHQVLAIPRPTLVACAQPATIDTLQIQGIVVQACHAAVQLAKRKPAGKVLLQGASTGVTRVVIACVWQALADRISADSDADRAAVLPTERAVLQRRTQAVHRFVFALM